MEDSERLKHTMDETKRLRTNKVRHTNGQTDRERIRQTKVSKSQQAMYDDFVIRAPVAGSIIAEPPSPDQPTRSMVGE